MRGIVFRGESNDFKVQWRFVLAQAVDNMTLHDMTFKDALLAYVYPDDIPSKATIVAKGIRVVDKDNGVVWFDDGYRGIEKKLFWRVEAPDGVYFCDNSRALCPDGTLIYFP